MRDDFASRLPLSRAALDRDHVSRARGVDALLAEPGAGVLVLHDRRVLLAATVDAAPRLALLDPPVPAELTIFLGRRAGDRAPVLAAVLDDDELAALAATGAVAAHAEWGDLRRIGAVLDDRDAGLATEALALANWHATHRFSPRTGAATDIAAAGWVRRDPETGTDLFPRTDAAIIVGVTDADDRLLLGSNALWEANRFSLLAGFVEPGESLEAAVEREVFEESGLRVARPRYLGSQPWPFPASLMLGFRAELAEGQAPDGTPDGEEILELRWFSRDELRAALSDIRLPGPTSIARAIVEDWFGGPIDDGSR